MAGRGAEESKAVNPRVRNLRKKIAEIEALEGKVARGDGFEPSEEQAEKMGRRAQFEEELRQLLAPPEPEKPAEPQAPLGADIESQAPAPDAAEDLPEASAEVAAKEDAEVLEPTCDATKDLPEASADAAAAEGVKTENAVAEISQTQALGVSTDEPDAAPKYAVAAVVPEAAETDLSAVIETDLSETATKEPEIEAAADPGATAATTAKPGFGALSAAADKSSDAEPRGQKFVSPLLRTVTAAAANGKTSAAAANGKTSAAAVNGKTSAGKNKKTVSSDPPTVASADNGKGDAAEEQQKVPNSRIRNLRKKLAEIDVLDKKMSAGNGFVPTEEQLEKMNRREQFEKELQMLEAPPPEPEKPPEPEPEKPAEPEASSDSKVEATNETKNGEETEEAAKPAEPVLEKAQSCKAPGKAFEIGMPVQVYYDGDWFAAQVSQINADRTCRVVYTEDNTFEDVRWTRVWSEASGMAEEAESSGPGRGKADQIRLPTSAATSPTLLPKRLDDDTSELSFPVCCRSPSMRWKDDPCGVEDVIPTPKHSCVKDEPAFEFIENIQPFSAAVKSNARLREIMKEVAELSKAAFEEDALEMVTRKAKWKMTLLAVPERGGGFGFSLDGDDAPRWLIGFLVYRLRPELQSLSIAKLAIVPEHRRQGHGCRFIDWCVQVAKKQKTIAFIALSSLPEAVKFYVKLGFRKHDIKVKDDDEDYVEGQVYMEKAIKGFKGNRRKSV